MRELSIVTDSTADIPPDIAKAYDIAIVPLMVNFGDETFSDGFLSQEDFFDRMNASPKLPTTSQPSVGAFVETYQRQFEAARTVVSVHISSALSGTIESAREAARQFGERVHVFDTLNLSGERDSRWLRRPGPRRVEPAHRRCSVYSRMRGAR